MWWIIAPIALLVTIISGLFLKLVLVPQGKHALAPANERIVAVTPDEDEDNGDDDDNDDDDFDEDWDEDDDETLLLFMQMNREDTPSMVEIFADFAKLQARIDAGEFAKGFPQYKVAA